MTARKPSDPPSPILDARGESDPSGRTGTTSWFTTWSMLLKWGLAIAILGFLAMQATQVESEATTRLLQGEAEWWLIIAAFVLFFCGVNLTFLRWHILVRVLGVPITLRSTIELGFLGFLLQFFSLGTVGGDVFKVVFLARRAAGQTANAVASILVDRVVGFFSMLLFGTVTIAISHGQGILPRELEEATVVLVMLSVASAAILYFLLYTRFSLSRILFGWKRLRWLLPLAARLDAGISRYRTHRNAIWWGVGLGLGAHVLEAQSLFLASRAFDETPAPLMAQMAIWPLAGTAGALPLTPGGLGTFDAAYVWLYDLVAAHSQREKIGLLVTVVFRMMCLATAGIGIIVYVSRRRELTSTGHQAPNRM